MAIGTTLKIAFDGKAVQRGLAGLKSSISSLASVGKNIAGIGASAAALGIAGAGAITALAVKINDIGEEAIASDNRVKNITESMGLFGDKADDVSDRLLDLADKQGRMLGIDDDIIAATEAKLMTFKELAATADTVGGAFDRATMAAVDMAAAGFGEAEQNAVQLGKALNDPVKGITALARAGITFTAEEKKSIAVMVEKHRMLEAQETILKAIEKQVGGTAAATATSSEKIKVSLGQVVEAFAKPFSRGFNDLPAALEGMFPELIAKATRLGELVAGAVTDAMRGNYDKFVAAGKLAGDVMGAAAVAAFQAGASSIYQNVENFMTQRKNWFTGEVNPQDLASQQENKVQFQDLFEAQLILRGVAKQLKDVSEGTQGLVPGSNGRFRFAQPGESSNLRDGNGNRVVEVLQKIERNTSGGAKM